MRCKLFVLRREPWSSGYGMRLEGGRFESRHYILEGHLITTLICSKIVLMFVCRGWPIKNIFVKSTSRERT